MCFCESQQPLCSLSVIRIGSVFFVFSLAMKAACSELCCFTSKTCLLSLGLSSSVEYNVTELEQELENVKILKKKLGIVHFFPFFLNLYIGLCFLLKTTIVCNTFKNYDLSVLQAFSLPKTINKECLLVWREDEHGFIHFF